MFHSNIEKMISEIKTKNKLTVSAAMDPDLALLAVVVFGAVDFVAAVCLQRILHTARVQLVQAESALWSMRQTVFN